MDRGQSQNQSIVFILESTDHGTIYNRFTTTKNDVIGFNLAFLHSDTMAV
jgi:hypothetical protein